MVSRTNRVLAFLICCACSGGEGGSADDTASGGSGDDVPQGGLGGTSGSSAGSSTRGGTGGSSGQAGSNAGGTSGSAGGGAVYCAFGEVISFEGDPGEVFMPAAAIDMDGWVTLVWAQEVGNASGHETRAVRFDPLADSVPSHEVLNHLAEATAGTDLNLRRSQTPVVVDEEGNVYVAWIENAPVAGTTSTGQSLVLRRYDKAEDAWSDTTILAPAQPNAIGNPTLAARDGAVVAAWSECATDDECTITAAYFDGQTWTKSEALGPGAFLPRSPVAEVDATGRGLVTWDSRSQPGTPTVGVSLATYDPSESAWSTPEALADSASQPTLAVGGDGTIFLGFTIEEAGVDNLFVRRRDADGEEFGPPEAAEGRDGSVDIPQLFAWPNGDALFLWGDFNDPPFASIYDSSTEAWLAEEELPAGGVNTSAPFGAATDSDGGLFVAWPARGSALMYNVKLPGEAWGTFNRAPFSGSYPTALALPTGGIFVALQGESDSRGQMVGSVCR